MLWGSPINIDFLKYVEVAPSIWAFLAEVSNILEDKQTILTAWIFKKWFYLFIFRERKE